MNANLLSWDIQSDTLRVVISYDGEEVMGIFLGEAMETAGRKVITEHIQEIERSPWIKNWHASKE